MVEGRTPPLNEVASLLGEGAVPHRGFGGTAKDAFSRGGSTGEAALCRPITGSRSSPAARHPMIGARRADVEPLRSEPSTMQIRIRRPINSYTDEELRASAERLRERRRQALRNAAPLICMQLREAELDEREALSENKN